MRTLALTIATLTLLGCALPKPTVIYQSADTIGVEFTDDGMMRVSNQQEAVAMVERHCGGRYRIVGGSEGRIDAVCVR